MNLDTPRTPTQQSGRGCLVWVVRLERQRRLSGDRDYRHRVFADQVTAEYSSAPKDEAEPSTNGNHAPKKTDNHWLDCLVGTASMQGALLFGTDRPFAPKR